MHVLFFFNHLNAFFILVFFSKVYIFHAFYYNAMTFDRPKMMLLKFDVMDFRDFLPNGLEGNGLQVGPVFLWSPCICKGSVVHFVH